MADIIIYTMPEKLLHKQGKLPDDEDYSETGDYYWSFAHFPKEVEKGDKVYFATKGFIRGYFIIKDIDFEGDGEAIIFNCDSWKDIDTLNYLNSIIPCKPFQGFKYADKVEELKDVN